jgi:hypothetical protein
MFFTSPYANDFDASNSYCDIGSATDKILLPPARMATGGRLYALTTVLALDLSKPWVTVKMIMYLKSKSLR